MADITRKVGDISPTNYVRPGVRDDSTANAISSLGNLGLELDAMLAKKRLGEGIDATTAQYLVSSPEAIKIQDAAGAEGDTIDIQLSQEEINDLNDFDKIRVRTLQAADQGRMTHAQYKLIVDRQLRMAIARRPGLANEFREVAGFFSGTAAVELLAAAEAASNKEKDDGRAARVSFAREQLAGAGFVMEAGGSPEEVLAHFYEHAEELSERAALQQRHSVLSMQEEIASDVQSINKPKATVGFIEMARTRKLNLLSATRGNLRNIANASPEEVKDLVLQGQTAIETMKSDLRAVAAQGDVSTDVRDQELAGLDAVQTILTEIATGDMDAKTLQNRAAVLEKTIEVALRSDEASNAVAGAISLYGPELMVGYMGPGGAFNQQAFNAFSNTFSGAVSPVTAAKFGGSNVSGFAQILVDKAKPASPEQFDRGVDVLSRTADSYSLVPDEQYKADWFTGGTGFIPKLAYHAEAIAKQASQPQLEQLASSVAAGAYNHQRVLQGFLFQKFPGLRERVDVKIDPKSGNLIHPKKGATLSGGEQDYVRQINGAFNGKAILSVMNKLLGGEPADAAKGIYAAMEYVHRARQSRGVEKRPSFEGTRGTGGAPRQSPDATPRASQEPSGASRREAVEAAMAKYGF